MDESDFSETESQQPSKKDVKKDKEKKKDKDKGYAHLDGESSPDIFDYSFTKSKKSKSFKFASSKSKDKPDKKKDKDKKDKEPKKEKEHKSKSSKDKKEKDEKKILSDEIGNIQPVFGVSVNLSTDFSRCHDGIDIPLVVRDCIDYLQDNGLVSEQIYKVEPIKSRLTLFKRAYNNHESKSLEEFDVPTACGLLKLFLKELPEPILTTDLTSQFEEASANAETEDQEQLLVNLLQLLPKYNRTLLAWIFLHFESVIQHEKSNNMNAQSLSMLLSPVLQMSHRLMMCLLFHSSNLFDGVVLKRYVPPLTSSSPNLPETIDEINIELRKQESLLSQIHSEMNAGFISKKREEQLWEVQRIITQLKRKLKNCEKSMDENTDEIADGEHSHQMSSSSSVTNTADIANDFKSKLSITESKMETSIHSELGGMSPKSDDEIITVHDSGMLLLPESHPDYWTLIRLQIENEELTKWKNSLKNKINFERSEALRLKKLLEYSEEQSTTYSYNTPFEESDHEEIVDHYMKENALLEHKRNLLINEILKETKELLQCNVELTMKSFNV